MAMLAQLKADEEAGLVEPTEWTVVEPDEPRPDGKFVFAHPKRAARLEAAKMKD